MLVDAGAATKKAAFDHEKLAAAISSATGKTYTALTLPFAPPTGGRGGAAGRGAAAATSSPLTFIDGERGIRFGSGGFLWKCTLTDYACAKEGPIPAPTAGGRGGAPAGTLPDGRGSDWRGSDWRVRMGQVRMGRPGSERRMEAVRDWWAGELGRGRGDGGCGDSPEMVGGDPVDGLEYQAAAAGGGTGRPWWAAGQADVRRGARLNRRFAALSTANGRR